MSEADIHVELREKTGHHTAKALRRSGRVPGIFYAHDEDSIPLSMNSKELERIVHSETNILNVIFPEGKSRKSVFKEVQKDPVTDLVIHVDVMGIKLTEKIKLMIPIFLVGTPNGVKEGGILEHLLREVELEGLPLDIPEHIEVDVSELEIGDVVTLENVSVEKVRIVTEIHHAVANVIHPKVIQEVEVEEEVLEEGEEAEKGEETEAAAEDADSQEKGK
jgi:large subunit ribosomal protein L25